MKRIVPRTLYHFYVIHTFKFCGETAMKKGSVITLILLLVPLSFVWQSKVQPFLASLTETAPELQPRDNRYTVPDFSLFSLQGDLVRLSDYRGSAVFIGFWATW